MTNCAAAALLSRRQSERLSDSRRAGVDQNSIRPRVKIFLQPREILVALFAGSPVTTRRFATGYTNESLTLDWRNFCLRCRTTQCARQDKGNCTQPARNASGHALRLAEIAPANHSKKLDDGMD